MKENKNGRSSRSITEAILYIAAFIFLAVAVYSGCRSYRIFMEYKKGKDTYKEISEHVVTKAVPAEEGNKEEKKWKGGCPITVDFDALKKENGDVIGWICCEGTQVSYPVLQGKTNDTYLRTMINGEYNTAGCIFMDTACLPDLSDPVSILYGHNMHDGSMFAIVDRYKDQAAYDAHPVYWYLTPGENYRLDVLAGYITPSDSPVYSLFGTEEEMDGFIDSSINESMFRASSYPEDISHIFVFSTCDYKYEGARFVLVCNTVREKDILDTEGGRCSFREFLAPSYEPDTQAISSPFIVSPGPAGPSGTESSGAETYPGVGTPAMSSSYEKEGRSIMTVTLDFTDIVFPRPGTYTYFLRGNLPEASDQDDEVRLLEVHVTDSGSKMEISGFTMCPDWP